MASSVAPASLDILIASDRPMVSAGLLRLIESGLPGTVVLSTDDPREALALLRRHAPRLCIAEPVMADAMRALGLGSCPPTRVLMLSARRHVGTDGMPGLSCACGHLSDAAEAPAIMAMLQRALACAHRSARDCGDTPCALKGSLAPVAPGLSERETEVLERLGRGQPPRTIARRMGISVKTVESYRSQIKQKLGFQDSRALLEFAVLWRRGADAGTRS